MSYGDPHFLTVKSNHIVASLREVVFDAVEAAQLRREPKTGYPGAIKGSFNLKLKKGPQPLSRERIGS